jgi:hypothetical protein
MLLSRVIQMNNSLFQNNDDIFGLFQTHMKLVSQDIYTSGSQPRIISPLLGGHLVIYGDIIDCHILKYATGIL